MFIFDRFLRQIVTAQKVHQPHEFIALVLVHYLQTSVENLASSDKRFQHRQCQRGKIADLLKIKS